MEEENINLSNEEEKTYFKEDSQKVCQNRKDLEFVLEITIDNLKQIILQKN